MSTSFRLRDMPGWSTEMDQFYRGRAKWYGEPHWRAPSDLMFQLAGDIVVPIRPPMSRARTMIVKAIDFVEMIATMQEHVTERVSGSGFRVIRGGAQ